MLYTTGGRNALRRRGVLAYRQALENRETEPGLACTHAGHTAAYTAGEATEYKTASAGIGWHAVVLQRFSLARPCQLLENQSPKVTTIRTDPGIHMIVFLTSTHPVDLTRADLESLLPRVNATAQPPRGQAEVFDNCLDRSGKVRTTGLLAWGPAGRIYLPHTDADDADFRYLLTTTIYVFTDLRHLPRQYHQPAPLSLYQQGYTSAVYPARFLNLANQEDAS